MACAASSSALFGPVPNLEDIILGKAGLGLLTAKGFLLGHLFGHNKAGNSTEDTKDCVF